jgi:predicted permease
MDLGGELARDVRGAFRTWRRRPVFAAVAVGTLALGIGANTAILTLVSAHFLTPLPYDDPDELALLWETDRASREPTTVSPGNYFAWRERARAFTDLAAYNVDRASLSGDGLAERVAASVVEPGFFDVLGVTPLLGAGFSEHAARAASGELVMLSHGLWTRRYGGDPGIVGRSIRVDGRPHTVVGVMPGEFRQPEKALVWQEPALWRPLLLDDALDDFRFRYLRVVARRDPAVPVERARAEMESLAAELAVEQPEWNEGRTVLVRTLDEYLLGDGRPILSLLLVAGLAVLLVTCANVANLMLARGEERRREFALRAALGSGRRRLLRQVSVEALVLAIAGAAAGTVLVALARDGLQAVQARYFSGLVGVSLDLRLVAATALLGLLAGLATGLPLAASVGRGELAGTLGVGGDRAVGGRRAGRARAALIVGQVAIATGLVVVAALLMRSFGALVSVPPGFRAEGVVAFDVSLPRETYPDRAAVEGYFRELVRGVGEVPGVSEVGLVSDLPFITENRYSELWVAGRVNAEGPPLYAEFHTALPGYFTVLGIPLLRGEMFVDGWAAPEAEIPVLVNARMASTVWADRDPLGEVFGPTGDPEVRFRVAGVVGDILDDGFDAAPEPAFFRPFGSLPQRGMSLVVRVAGDPADALGPLREVVARLDTEIPVTDLRPLDDLLAATVARPRAASLIAGVIAGLALLVAAAGIYGVLSFAVERRTREIGVRAALGASRPDLVAMVLRETGRLVAAGLALGALGALVAGRALSGVLFGVPAWDPPSFAAAGAALATVAALAAWIPARRAVRVAPTEALRTE